MKLLKISLGGAFILEFNYLDASLSRKRSIASLNVSVSALYSVLSRYNAREESKTFKIKVVQNAIECHKTVMTLK